MRPSGGFHDGLFRLDHEAAFWVHFEVFAPMFSKGKSKKKKKVAAGDRVFNDRPRKVFRHYIGRSEVGFGVFFVVFTAVMGGWFVLQRDNYNPNDRDISMDVLLAEQVEDHLWEPPLLRWSEPGSYAAAGGAGPAAELGIYPASTLGDGWEAVTPLEKFDNSNLYEKVNGQETQYKSFGFQFLHFMSIGLPSDKLEVNIELYDMGDFKNALGVFAAQRSADSKVEKHGGAYLYLTEVGALGIVDKYYFKFTGDTPSPKIQEHALKIVGDFAAAQAAGGTAPKSFALLADGMGLDFANIQYVPEDVFQYAFAKEFWFGKKSPDSNEQYFVHQAASADEAAKLLAQVLEEHQFDYKLVSREGDRAVLQHNFLKNYFSIEQRDDFVFGVDQAPDTGEASKSVEALAAKLFEEIE